MRFNLNPRFGNVRPFISVGSTNGGAGGEVKAGVVSYVTKEDGTEQYSISEIGGTVRSDHTYDMIQARLGNDVPVRLVSDEGTDVFATGTIKQNAKVKEGTAIQPTVDPAAACAEVALNAPAA